MDANKQIYKYINKIKKIINTMDRKEACEIKNDLSTIFCKNIEELQTYYLIEKFTKEYKNSDIKIQELIKKINVKTYTYEQANYHVFTCKFIKISDFINIRFTYDGDNEGEGDWEVFINSEEFDCINHLEGCVEFDEEEIDGIYDDIKNKIGLISKNDIIELIIDVCNTMLVYRQPEPYCPKK
jgi:hypothetical protein